MKTLWNAKDWEETAEGMRRVRVDRAAVGEDAGAPEGRSLGGFVSKSVGEKALAPRPGRFGEPVREVGGAVCAAIVPRNGIKTMPDMDQERGGTPPAGSRADTHKLARLFERFTRQPRDFEWRPRVVSEVDGC
jgi:hypothetical protein